MEINENISKRIIALRFILVFFILLIHNNITELHFVDNLAMNEYQHIIILKIQQLIGIIVYTTILPTYFLLSGYLIYAKEIKFIIVVKKKCRSILLPYFIWTLLAILFFYIAQSFSFTKIYFTTPRTLIRQFGVLDWIDVFWGKLTPMAQGYPLVGQFWFLRDLFILDLLFLVIKKLIDLFPLGTFIFFFIIWLTDINIYIVSTSGLLFFSLGYYIVKYSLNEGKIDKINIIELAVVCLLTLCIELFFNKHVPQIHTINTFLGCIFLIRLSWFLVRKKYLYEFLKKLEKYSFFVFAIHLPYLLVLNKLYMRIIPISGLAGVLLQYFCIAIFGTTLFLTIGVIIRKKLPKIFALVTGNRL
ncbi:acyltransferase family protein [Treponema primitia]|uniref:acyltransferase family protein n=1 Tax=Treponema primitia TaxID=88058 RepID=UPI0002554D64|nr:acyltransferase family protein [Treponema primitia]